MDKICEDIIVNTFFNKNGRERIMFELASSKRRNEALNRLCHDYEKVLDQRYMIPIPRPNSDYLGIMSLLLEYGASPKDPCYSLSYNEEIDGKYLSLVKALEKAVGYGFPSIISCNQVNLHISRLNKKLARHQGSFF